MFFERACTRTASVTRSTYWVFKWVFIYKDLRKMSTSDLRKQAPLAFSVVLVFCKLGSPVALVFRKSGSPDALVFRKSGSPDALVFRKSGSPVVLVLQGR